MATSKRRAEHQRDPDWQSERGLAALKKQLKELDNLKGRRFDEAASDEDEWNNLTHSIVERVFGKESSHMDKFCAAETRGEYSLFRSPDGRQEQSNFEQRIAAFEALLKSMVAEIEMFSPPGNAMQTAFSPDEEYLFYRRLAEIMASARRSVFLVDAYLDETVFNLYVDKVADAGIKIQILSNKIGPNVEVVARMYAKSNRLELRVSTSFHDRVLFCDDRGWTFGQSIKDAAKKKPTYMVELQEPALSTLRAAHEPIWHSAKILI